MTHMVNIFYFVMYILALWGNLDINVKVSGNFMNHKFWHLHLKILGIPIFNISSKNIKDYLSHNFIDHLNHSGGRVTDVQLSFVYPSLSYLTVIYWTTIDSENHNGLSLFCKNACRTPLVSTPAYYFSEGGLTERSD